MKKRWRQSDKNRVASYKNCRQIKHAHKMRIYKVHSFFHLEYLYKIPSIRSGIIEFINFSTKSKTYTFSAITLPNLHFLSPFCTHFKATKWRAERSWTQAGPSSPPNFSSFAPNLILIINIIFIDKSCVHFEWIRAKCPKTQKKKQSLRQARSQPR